MNQTTKKVTTFYSEKVIESLIPDLLKSLRKLGVKQLDFGRGDEKKEQYELITFYLNGKEFELIIKEK